MSRTPDPLGPAPSTVAIGGHPLHPMLVPLPIAYLLGALLTDIAYWAGADPFWARASLWLVGAGLVTGLLAAAGGLIDFLTIARARRHAAGWIHLVGNATVLLLAAVSLALRWGDAQAAVVPWGLTISVLTALLLAVTGWYGGELVFRHRIGVAGDRRPPAEVEEPRAGPGR